MPTASAAAPAIAGAPGPWAPAQGQVRGAPGGRAVLGGCSARLTPVPPLPQYYDDTYPSVKEQKAFEKNIFNKTHRTDSTAWWGGTASRVGWGTGGHCQAWCLAAEGVGGDRGPWPGPHPPGPVQGVYKRHLTPFYQPPQARLRCSRASPWSTRAA